MTYQKLLYFFFEYFKLLNKIRIFKTIPYSLHSNYKEIEDFVKSICPGKLIKIVENQGRVSDKIYNVKTFKGYMTTLQHLKQRGDEIIRKKYEKTGEFSENYRDSMVNFKNFSINNKF